MLFKKKKVRAQGYTEYIVLIAGVLSIAAVIYGVVQAIGDVYQSKQSDIEDLGSW